MYVCNSWIQAEVLVNGKWTMWFASNCLVQSGRLAQKLTCSSLCYSTMPTKLCQIIVTYMYMYMYVSKRDLFCKIILFKHLHSMAYYSAILYRRSMKLAIKEELLLSFLGTCIMFHWLPVQNGRMTNNWM